MVSSVSNTGNHIKIVSGKELFVSDGELNFSTWNLDFDFPGTLIYFDIPVDSLDDNDSVDFEL